MPNQTSASIEISAQPVDILAVIADFAHYPEWVDSITSAEVLGSAGGMPDRVRMVLDHPVVKDDYILAYTWSPAMVSWRLVKGTLLRAMDGSYTLEPSARGTRVTYALAVDVNLPMIGVIKRKAEKTIIDSALKGLKRRVER